MKFDSNCKAIIESMNWIELKAYIFFLTMELWRHKVELVLCVARSKTARMMEHLFNTDKFLDIDSFVILPDDDNGTYYHTLCKLWQSAIYRHRLDIKSTRECILRAEDRMEMLEFLQ